MNLQRCLLPGLAMVAWLGSQPLRASVAPAENPFTPIVERNIFALVPIPVHNPADDVPAVPPPKITPNGIMTLFGKLQVLFKVAGVVRPGLPLKDESYMMCQGDRQDDIEVQKIDQKTATITFNNHGVIQELSLVTGTSVGGVPPPPGVPAPGMAPGNGGPPRVFGGRFGRGRNNVVTSGGNPDAGVPPGLASGTASANGTPAKEQITPEVQVIMMEAQRMQWQNEGDPETAKAVIPPTELTPIINGDNGNGGGDTMPAHENPVVPGGP